jgi:hypothetical protein
MEILERRQEPHRGNIDIGDMNIKHVHCSARLQIRTAVNDSRESFYNLLRETPVSHRG